MNKDTSHKEMVFWGATGQAKVLRECMQKSGIKLVAVFDNNPDVPSPFDDIPIFYGKDDFERWKQSRSYHLETGFLVAVGGDRGKDRISIHEYLVSQGLIPLLAQHPTAFVAANAQIGEGSQILAQSAVCVRAVLGRSCIVNTGAIVDHECRIGDGVHICPGAHLAGCVEIGDFSTVYTGAVILPRIKVGERAVIGAGAVVIEDVPSYSTVVGNPARLIRQLRKD
ncbi:MAG: acetyltransferase [Anaerolineales bacterium]|nr:acetyltransferase [Anaerolineales bacterium]